jgi:WD40 repeat protein
MVCRTAIRFAGGLALLLSIWAGCTPSHTVHGGRSVLGQPLQTFRHTGDFILEIAWSPDGRRLAAKAGGSPEIMLWDMTSGRTISQLRQAMNLSHPLALSSDGKTLIAPSIIATPNDRSTSLSLIDAYTSDVVRHLIGPQMTRPSVLEAIAIRPGRDAAALMFHISSPYHQTVWLIDTRDWTKSATIVEAIQYERVSGSGSERIAYQGRMRFSPDGQQLAMSATIPERGGDTEVPRE